MGSALEKLKFHFRLKEKKLVRSLNRFSNKKLCYGPLKVVPLMDLGLILSLLQFFIVSY